MYAGNTANAIIAGYLPQLDAYAGMLHPMPVNKPAIKEAVQFPEPACTKAMIDTTAITRDNCPSRGMITSGLVPLTEDNQAAVAWKP